MEVKGNRNVMGLYFEKPVIGVILLTTSEYKDDLRFCILTETKAIELDSGKVYKLEQIENVKWCEKWFSEGMDDWWDAFDVYEGFPCWEEDEDEET